MDVLRLCVVKALRGKTWAGEGVFDSPASPGDIRVKGKRAPFIAVYVDEQDISDPMNGSLGMPGEENVVRLILEVGVASSHVFNAEGEQIEDGAPAPKGSYVGTSLDATDQGLELQMGLISRQAVDALTSTSESNPWAQIFNGLCPGTVRGLQIRRGGPPNDQARPQARYASRITIIHLATLAEPVRGSDIAEYPFWTMFFEACAGDEDLKDVGAIIRSHIERPDGALPAWRLAQKHLGVPYETIAILGLGPIVPGDDTAATLAKAGVADGGPPAIPPRDDPDRQGFPEE